MLKSTATILDILQEHKIPMKDGLTVEYIEHIQKTFDIIFPVDFKDMLMSFVPSADWFTDWSDLSSIEDKINFPIDWIIFDIEHNDLWLDNWWNKDCIKDYRKHFSSVSRLIPIYEHRYVCGGNMQNMPVFSVYQSDIIVYWDNLVNYFMSEFNQTPLPESTSVYVPFWSDLLFYNNHKL